MNYQNKKMAVHKNLLFAFSWLRAPLKVGAITPSGKRLGAFIASEIDLDRPGAVIELGGGTGAVTRALLDGGVAPEKLVVLERDEKMVQFLRENFSNVQIIDGDAAKLPEILKDLGIDEVNTVISGLPMLSFKAELQQSILEGAFNVMPEDGRIVQFTYSMFAPPISRKKLAEWGMQADGGHTVWLNLPPATVWRFTKTARAD